MDGSGQACLTARAGLSCKNCKKVFLTRGKQMTGLADSRIKVLKSTKQFWDKENNLDKYGYLELPSDNVESSLSFEPREAIVGRPSLSLSFEETKKLTWPPLSLHSNPFS